MNMMKSLHRSNIRNFGVSEMCTYNHIDCNFPMCVIECFLKLSARVDAKSHLLHLFDFSPVCIFKWALKLPAREDA